MGKPDISFLDYIRRAIVNFLGKYNSLLAKNPKMAYYCRAIEEDKSLAPADLLSNLMYLVAGSGCDLYVIIDEYDNFANTLLTTSGSAAYLEVTRGKGFLRSNTCRPIKKSAAKNSIN